MTARGSSRWCATQAAPKAFAAAERVRGEYVLKVVGKVIRREPGLVNPKLPTGEVEVVAASVEILNPAAPPPFQLDEANLNENVRLTHRVIDLRRPQMQKNLVLRYRLATSEGLVKSPKFYK